LKPDIGVFQVFFASITFEMVPYSYKFVVPLFLVTCLVPFALPARSEKTSHGWFHTFI
jgi:hypothetical protein